MPHSPTDPLFQVPDFEAAGHAAPTPADDAADDRDRAADTPPEVDPGAESGAESGGEPGAGAPKVTRRRRDRSQRVRRERPPEPERKPEETEDDEDAVPLLELREPLPGVVNTPEELERACRALAAATGPVALDAERASGYRYSQRAYLIQIRREGAGSWLVDPIAFGQDLSALHDALGGAQWILHAATQDIACLREAGLHPTSIFDTELAGRLLGYPRVGLATLVEVLLGRRLRKEHSAADWSTRPLPEPWLEYAALDVEVLIELRLRMVDELAAAGKTAWAEQEFTHLLDFAPTVRTDAWRRVSGLHKLKGRRPLAVAKSIWEARDAIAAERDVTPGRIIPDSAIVVAAATMPTDKGALLDARGFHGRGASRYADVWLDAVAAAQALDEADLPTRSAPSQGPPQPRLWADKDPVAGERWTLGRQSLTELAEDLSVPLENLLTPDSLRRLLWKPPATRDVADLTDAVADQLRGYGAREWQVDLTAAPLAQATIEAEQAVGQD